jgi:hypothetical protein
VHLDVVPEGALTELPTNGLTVTFVEKGELVDPLQPFAKTVTTAVPRNPLFHVTTPPDVIVPAAAVMLQV